MSFYAFLLLTLSCILRPSTALFKDQAGKWDWRQSYIGRAKFIESDATQSGIKRVFVATHDNALAAVNARLQSFLSGGLCCSDFDERLALVHRRLLEKSRIT